MRCGFHGQRHGFEPQKPLRPSAMAFIRTLKAREILDSRGNPTIEAL